MATVCVVVGCYCWISVQHIMYAELTCPPTLRLAPSKETRSTTALLKSAAEKSDACVFLC